MPYEISDKGRDYVDFAVKSGDSNIINAWTTVLRVALHRPEDLEYARTLPVYDKVIEDMVRQGYLH